MTETVHDAAVEWSVALKGSDRPTLKAARETFDAALALVPDYALGTAWVEFADNGVVVHWYGVKR